MTTPEDPAKSEREGLLWKKGDEKKRGGGSKRKEK